MLAESEFELKHLRGDMEAARKTEADLRTAIAELDGRSCSATAAEDRKTPSLRPNSSAPRKNATGSPAISAT